MSAASEPEAADRPADGAGGDERRNAALWAAARRQERVLAAWIGIGAVLGTLYFAAVNAYLLVKARPAPVQLSFERPSGAAGTYGVRVAWRPLASGAPAVRPTLQLAGTPIPEAGAQSDAPVVSLDEARDLRVEVGADTTPGRHEGDLVLTRHGYPTTAPESLSAPLVVGVTGGFWQSWFLVRNWLILALTLMLLCYLLCLAIFPRPSGSLVVHRVGAERADRTQVALDRRALAILLPWLRSTLPLALLGRQAGVPELARVPGWIEFQFASLPLIVVEDPAGEWQVGRTPAPASSWDEPPESEFGRVAPVAIMHGDVFRFSRLGGGVEVRIQYVRAGGAFQLA